LKEVVSEFAESANITGGLKVDTITTTGNVDISGSLNVETSLTTNQLIVNDDLYFNTIVIKKQFFDNESIGNVINLTELQCWVNGNILLGDNNDTLITNFVNWDTKEIGEPLIESSTGDVLYASNIHNVDLTDMAHNIFTTTNAIIINNVPLTTIKNIQSIVLYNRVVRVSQTFLDRAIGLNIELYNIDNDPNLETPLATTNEISSGDLVYRYDFPAIDTYPSGDFSDTDSLTNIASETLATKEVVSEFAESVNITGGLTCDTITLPIIGDVGTEIQGKQDTIDTATDLTCNSITTIGNGTIGGNLTITGSLTNRNQPAFKATTTQTLQPSVDTNIIFNNPIMDNDSGYNSCTGEYTIQSAENWYFYYSFQSNGVAFKVHLQQDGVAIDQVFTDLALTTDTDLGCKGMVIVPCVVGDVIRIRVKTGSVGIENGGFLQYHSFGGFLIG